MTLRRADVEQARWAIAERIYVSPCARSQTLSERLGCELYLKLENLQMTGSFKERGALYRLLSLDAAEREAGVVAASAGNHAQGVAFAARSLGIDACIVMPLTTPLIKVTSTRRHGARVVLHGEGYDEAHGEALRIADAEGRVLVHPFDDELVIAGQGTVGLELVEQVPDLEAVVLPLGGGGLAAGVAAAISETHPAVALYGVEPAVCPSHAAAFAAGAPVTVPGARSLADGAVVRRVGALALEVLKGRLEQVVAVGEEEIAEALLLLLEEEKTVAEGAGAMPLAALLQGRLPVSGKRVVAVLSGGNIDVTMLSRVIDRGLARSGRSSRLRVVLPDVPGALARLLSVVASEGANVLQIAHDRVGVTALGLGMTEVQLTLETRGFEHVDAIARALAAAGFESRS